MFVLKYLLVIPGTGLFGRSGALLVYAIFLSSHLRRLLGRRDKSPGELLPGDPIEVGRPLPPVRWGLAQRLAAAGVLPLLLAFSIAVVPDGFAGVRVSQSWGARPGTLYPGVHLITPLVDSVELYDTREQVYTTAASRVANPQGSAATTSQRRFEQQALLAASRLKATLREFRAGTPLPGGQPKNLRVAQYAPL